MYENLYLTMLDDRFVVMNGDAIIDCDNNANVLIKRYGSMTYVG